jgi:hypothetical protein
MLSPVLRGRVWLVVSLFVWLPIFVVLTGGGDSRAAEYAVDQGSNIYSIAAGVVNAGGDLYEDGDGNSLTAILVMPSYAHFINRGLGFGGDLLLLHLTQGDAGETILGLGPKVVYFFGGEESKSYPFITAGFYYVRNTEDFGKSTYTIDGTRFKFGGGVSIMASAHLGVLMEASYNLDSLKGENSKKSVSGNMVVVSVGLVGFSF